eukprot:Nitzschia sp. Nitz4//scaffold40_size135432//94625//94956//NITZ4_003257-RA/size135432-snap-gene-0.129-mRNA-1//-1//CDS//3329551258//453//frame0
MVRPLATSNISFDEAQGDLAFCQRMASHVSKASDLPAVCGKFPSVFSDVQRMGHGNQRSIAFSIVRAHSAATMS